MDRGRGRGTKGGTEGQREGQRDRGRVRGTEGGAEGEIEGGRGGGRGAHFLEVEAVGLLALRPERGAGSMALRGAVRTDWIAGRLGPALSAFSCTAHSTHL